MKKIIIIGIAVLASATAIAFDLPPTLLDKSKGETWGFEFTTSGKDAQTYQQTIDGFYGGVKPKKGQVLEWVVDEVDESTNSYTVRGHYRAK